jgi:Gas vesicle synthesis protein GvpL/GvpF
VRALPVGGLFALAGDVAEAPALDAEALRAYESAVRRLAAACDAFLPARFGSVVDEVDLGSGEPDLRAALALVRGREQMTLRVFGPRIELERSSGTAYLQSRRKERALAELDPLRAALGPLAQAERVEAHDGTELRASVYHLIPRGTSAEYLRLVKSVPLSVNVVPSGPWPAWSFAPEALR